MFNTIKDTELLVAQAVRSDTQAAYISLSASGKWNGSKRQNTSQPPSPRYGDSVFKMLALGIFYVEYN